jgi:hypothetical protein
LLTDSLRSFVSETEWCVPLVQMVAGTVQDRSAESLDGPIPSPQGIGAPMVQLLIERLRCPLGTIP